ncbi:hypothetical protein AGOR_G00184430 [Albula goreensis]|uniref:Uncharacterized protein n=1 Tax=Albula goreensis TaxID=1534307 RepID=A0A8T3CT65_9TELE|nr:hypothetical protein AGOR_G00184430 [Albula goreensis]
MTMALLLKLLLVLLVSSISESQRSCSSEMGKKQGDTLLCKEEPNNLYTEIEHRSQKDHTCQTPGKTF